MRSSSSRSGTRQRINGGVNLGTKIDRINWSFEPQCGKCQKTFRGMILRRHHCRLCGGSFCNTCASHRVPVKGSKGQTIAGLHRACDACAAQAPQNTGSTVTPIKTSDANVDCRGQSLQSSPKPIASFTSMEEQISNAVDTETQTDDDELASVTSLESTLVEDANELSVSQPPTRPAMSPAKSYQSSDRLIEGQKKKECSEPQAPGIVFSRDILREIEQHRTEHYNKNHTLTPLASEQLKQIKGVVSPKWNFFQPNYLSDDNLLTVAKEAAHSKCEQQLKWIGEGNVVFAFDCKPGAHCNRQDRQLIAALCNTTGFKDECVENGQIPVRVPPADSSFFGDANNNNQQPLHADEAAFAQELTPYTVILCKTSYILPGVNIENAQVDADLLGSLRYNKGCQPGNPQFNEVPPGMEPNTYRLTRVVIPYVFKMLIQFRVAEILPSSPHWQYIRLCDNWVRNSDDGNVLCRELNPCRALLIERTKNNRAKQDATVRCKSLLLYYSVPSPNPGSPPSTLVSHITVVLNTSLPRPVAALMARFSSNGLAEAMETAAKTRHWLRAVRVPEVALTRERELQSMQLKISKSEAMPVIAEPLLSNTEWRKSSQQQPLTNRESQQKTPEADREVHKLPPSRPQPVTEKRLITADDDDAVSKLLQSVVSTLPAGQLQEQPTQAPIVTTPICQRKDNNGYLVFYYLGLLVLLSAYILAVYYRPSPNQ